MRAHFLTLTRSEPRACTSAGKAGRAEWEHRSDSQRHLQAKVCNRMCSVAPVMPLLPVPPHGKIRWQAWHRHQERGGGCGPTCGGPRRQGGGVQAGARGGPHTAGGPPQRRRPPRRLRHQEPLGHAALGRRSPPPGPLLLRPPIPSPEGPLAPRS